MQPTDQVGLYFYMIHVYMFIKKVSKLTHKKKYVQENSQP